ncbi:MAG TPA: DUF1707 domain-containing protein [Streptosporangiaceae bacterium]
MTDLPERSDHRLMRVSDADREKAAEVLRDAAGQGRLTFDELEDRLGQAYAAKTYADLEEVTRDLPGPGIRAPVGPAAGRFPAERIGGRPSSAVAIAVMSGAKRAGPWVVPPVFTAFALMGGVELDLRHARFSQPEVTIHAYALMGGVEVTVGEDVEVDVAGFGFMGGFDHRASGPGIPGAPRVRIVGFALMGGVDVKRKHISRRRPPREGDQRPEITG